MAEQEARRIVVLQGYQNEIYSTLYASASTDAATTARALSDAERSPTKGWHTHGSCVRFVRRYTLQRRYVSRRYFKPALRAAGLSEALSLYALRHSCATLLLKPTYTRRSSLKDSDTVASR